MTQFPMAQDQAKGRYFEEIEYTRTYGSSCGIQAFKLTIGLLRV